MTKLANHKARNGIHVGLIALAMKLQKGFLPSGIPLREQGVFRDHVFVLKNTNWIEQMNGLYKGFPHLFVSTRISQQYIIDAGISRATRIVPIHNGPWVRKRQRSTLLALGKWKRIEARMVTL